MNFENLPMYLLLGVTIACSGLLVYMIGSLLGMAVGAGALVGLAMFVAALIAIVILGWIAAKVFRIDD